MITDSGLKSETTITKLPPSIAWVLGYLFISIFLALHFN